jgi:hypothetical protein
VMALKDATADRKDGGAMLPILADKKALGSVTTYICRDSVCQAPLVGVEAVQTALAEA